MITAGLIMLGSSLWLTGEGVEYSSITGIWVFFGFPGLALLLVGMYWLHEELPKALVGIFLMLFGLIVCLNGASFIIVPIGVSGLGLLVVAQAFWRIRQRNHHN